MGKKKQVKRNPATPNAKELRARYFKESARRSVFVRAQIAALEDGKMADYQELTQAVNGMTNEIDSILEQLKKAGVRV